MLFLATLAFADEGMWLPEQIPQLAGEYKDKGLTIDPAEISDPTGAVLGAVVSVGGYCSGSFVTPDGLVLTNHHCVEEFLQFNSDATHDLGKDGFSAKSRADELSGGPGTKLYVVEKIEDVTEKVLGKTRKLKDDTKRTAAVELAQKTLVAACEKQEDRRCRVADYWGGETYRLITWLEIEDVRLVYAPPEGLGQFGGEIDNWMWPRHGGDFGVLRAYTSKDGKLTPFSKDNVPYHPKRILKIQENGIEPGDFVMAAGFPGRTVRNALGTSLHFDAEKATPVDLDLEAKSVAILEKIAAGDKDAAPKLRAPIDWLKNSEKYDQGILDNLRQSDVLALKDASEGELLKWIDADAKRKAKYGPVAAELQKLAEAENARRTTGQAVKWVHRSADVLATAVRLVRLAEERKKPDLEREEGYQDRDLPDIEDSLARMDKTEVFAADLALLRLALEYHQSLAKDLRAPQIDAWLAANGGLDGAMKRLESSTALLKNDARLALMKQDFAAMQKSTDPWVQLAVAIADWSRPQRAIDKQQEGAFLRLMPVWLAAERELRPGRVYPDANNTLRVTLGHVKGYSPKDGVWYLPQTTLAGMVAKVGDAPFDAPKDLVARAKDGKSSRFADPKLGDVPVDFLSDLDSTGGNSGSPTLNGNGELVGLLFDGNYESMSADWVFQPELTRSIHVDVRYVLWILDGDPATKWMVTEMVGH